MLRDERQALLEKTFRRQVPLSPADAEDVGAALAAAMGRALEQVTREIASEVGARLALVPPAMDPQDD